MSSHNKKILDGFLSGGKKSKKPGTDTLDKAKSIIKQMEAPTQQTDNNLSENNQQSDQTNDHKENKSIKKQNIKQSSSRRDKRKDKPIRQPHDIPVLNKNEAILYYSLLKLTKCFTTCTQIEATLNISRHTVRKCLKRLREKGVIDYEHKNIHGKFGLEITAYQALVNVFDKEEVINRLEKIDVKSIPLFSTLIM